MGLLDLTSKVITEYKADIGDHKAKIKELTGAQKDLAKEELKAAEARNAQLDDQIKGLAKVGVALAGVAAAVAIGKAGFDEYSKYQRLSAQVSSETLTKLKEASGGLRSEMDLLSFAARTQHATFKLNADQQALTLEAMRALEKQGFDTEKVFEQVTKAVVEANGEGLKEFGISVDNGKSKAEAFKNVMAALADETKKVGGNLNREGDEVRRMGVQWDDAMSKLKRAIGEIVVALGPLLSVIGDIGGVLADVVGELSSVVSSLLKPITLPGQVSLGTIISASMVNAQTRQALSQQASADESAYLSPTLAASHEIDPRIAARYAQASNVRWAKITAALQKASDEAYGKVSRVAARDAALSRRIGGSVASDGLLREPKPGEFDLGVGSGITIGGFEGEFGGTGEFQGMIDQRGRDINRGAWDSFWSRWQSGAAADARQTGKLEKIFGPLSDFQAYAAGFQLLEGALTSAFTAWVTGSDSALNAARKFVAGYLQNMSTQLFGEALKELAYGVAYSFIPLRAAEAPGHFAAAAKFAAAAATVGGLSIALGGGGGSSTTGGATAAPVGTASASASSGQTRTTLVLLGDETGEESPRRRQNRAAAALERARRVTSADDGVIYG